MPKIDIIQLVEDSLTEAYASIKGKSPKGWSLRPSDDTVGKILSAFSEGDVVDHREIILFCRKAMFAHLAKTAQTGTPFFVNSHLLAQSTIEYIEKHEQYLTEFYGKGHDPEVFKLKCHTAFFPSEQDWLLLTIQSRGLSTDDEPINDCSGPDWGGSPPTPLWVLWSIEWGRLSLDNIPTSWMEEYSEWDDSTRPNGDHLSVEKNKSKERVRRSMVEKVLLADSRRAAISFCAAKNLAKVIYRPDGRVDIAPNSLMTADTFDLPPHERDQEIIRVMRSKCVPLKGAAFLEEEIEPNIERRALSQLPSVEDL